MPPPDNETPGRVNVSVDFPDLTAIRAQLTEHSAGLDAIREKMSAQGESWARIDENLKNITKNLNGRIPKLEDRQDELADAVQVHDRQISRWQGAIAILAFLVLLIGGVVVEQWHSYTERPAAPDGRVQQSH